MSDIIAFNYSGQLVPYLQEQKAEGTWAHILRNANISDGMNEQSNVNRLSNANNWGDFSHGLDLCSAGLMSVQQIAGNYQSYLEKKAKKGASAISLHDVQVFVADKIWEAKLTNDAILNPALKLQAQFWQCDRTYRARLHEAMVKSGKWFLEEIKTIHALGGVAMSSEQFQQYLHEYGDRQQAFLDDLLNSRQSQAKQIVAQEIGKALGDHQLPEAK